MKLQFVKPLASVLLLICVKVCLAGQGNPTAPLQPVALVDDFSDGMRDGWESYPLVEDDGYDPSLNPITQGRVHGLTREVVPTQTGELRIGFVRKLDLVTGNSGEISFQYQLSQSTAAPSVHVELFDGSRSQTLDFSATTGDWQSATLRLPVSKIHLKAVAIYLVLPDAEAGNRVQFSIAKVEIRGLAVPRLQLSAPSALWDEHRGLYYLASALRPGDKLLPHFNGPASITLAAPDGKQVSTASDGSYTFTVSDPIGIWSLHAHSAAGQARVLLLLLPVAHKGLVFDAPPLLSSELLVQIRLYRDKLAAKVHVELGPNIAQYDDHWLIAGLPSYAALLEPPAELALMDAVLYQSEGDKAALEQSRSILLSMCSWPTWVHPWFPAHGYRTYYPVGIVAGDIALTREYLGDSLTAAEQNTIDKALLKKAIVPAYEEYVQADRLPFNVSNWIGNITGGSLLAALTVKNPAAGYALGLFEKDLEHIHAAYTPDGDYGEGTSYLPFDMEMTAIVAASAKRNLGMDLDPLLGDSDKYLRTALYGRNSILDFGDTHADLASVDVFAYMAAAGISPETTAFYREHRQPEADRLIPRILWDGDAMKQRAAPTVAPSSALFPISGKAILRDGPGPNARLIAMRTGANFNHNHADQGSVSIASNGEAVLDEAGYADYYKDPFYSTFNIQAAGHNVLLVDGDPQSQIWPGNHELGGFPSFRNAWLGKAIDVVQADLTTAYGGKLKSYTRWVVAPKQGPVVIVDEITADASHRYSLLWHPADPPEVANQDQTAFVIPGKEHKWEARSFASTAVSQIVEPSPLPLASYARSESELILHPRHVEVVTSEPVQHAAFATVFAPLSLGTPKQEQAKFMADGGVTLTLGSWLLRVAGDCTSKCNPALIANWEDGFLLIRGTSLVLPDRMIESDMPLSLEAERGNDGWQLRIETEAPAILRLSGFGLAAFSNGKQVSADGKALILHIAKGISEWSLR